MGGGGGDGGGEGAGGEGGGDGQAWPATIRLVLPLLRPPRTPSLQ